MPRAAWEFNVNLSTELAIPTQAGTLITMCFVEFKNGTADAPTHARRSGAQRGALENKLRPEVFLGAPLLFQFFLCLQRFPQPERPSHLPGSVAS